MGKLEVRFTIKGEQNETTFNLIKNDAGFWLKGISEVSGIREYSVEFNSADNSETTLLAFKNSMQFEENDNVIDERMLSLTEEYLSATSEGFELDFDIEESVHKPGYKPEDIYVENKTFSISDIMDFIKEGDLEISPSFQRNFVWDKKRQSKLIESVLLGLPLPSIYLSQYSDGRLTIVDGLQRITTISRFMKDELRLCDMEYFENCNGKTYSELKKVLPLLQYRRFRQTQLTCYVIDYRSPNALKFDLFRRLNTGGKALNDQEVRNCLSRPHLQKLLLSMIETDEFKKATGGTVKDTRMAAQESALRFIYFYEQYSDNNSIGDYNGNMSASLDVCVDKLNGVSPDKLSQYVDIYRNSMQMAFDLFGDYTFRKVDLKTMKKTSVNKPLMLAISVLLAHHYDTYKPEVANRIKLINELGALLSQDQEFSKKITAATTSKANIKYTFEILKTELFDKYLLK